MYDFDLHARFLRSVTEAWTNYLTAGMAAFGMWQSQFANSVAGKSEPPKPSPEAPAASNPFAWWLNAFTPNPQPARASATAVALPHADPFSWWLNAFTPDLQPARASATAVALPHADPFSWWLNAFTPDPQPARASAKAVALPPADPFSWWLNAFSPNPQPARASAPATALPSADPFSWWLNVWAPAPASAPEKSADFGAPFFQFAPSIAAWTPPSGLIGGSGAGQNPWTQIQNFWTQNPWMQNPWFTNNPWFSAATNQNATAWTSGWQDAMNACCWMWPNASFNAFQMPMTAWLMAVGLPYSVAAPTARANAASMDAAQAAHEGFEKLMATFRNDSGHALAPMFSIFPKIATLLVPFWLLPRGLPGLG